MRCGNCGYVQIGQLRCENCGEIIIARTENRDSGAESVIIIVLAIVGALVIASAVLLVKSIIERHSVNRKWWMLGGVVTALAGLIAAQYMFESGNSDFEWLHTAMNWGNGLGLLAGLILAVVYKQWPLEHHTHQDASNETVNTKKDPSKKLAKKKVTQKKVITADTYFSSKDLKITSKNENNPAVKLLEENILNQRQFWETFFESGDSPICHFRKEKSDTLVSWTKLIKQDHESLGYLNIIFENTPLLNGEYPASYAEDTGMIITNYRLFCNFEDGLRVIPLANLKFYGIEAIKGGWLEDDTEEFKIVYSENTVEKTLTPEWAIQEDYVKEVLSKKEWEVLPSEVVELLGLTYFELNRKLGVNISKIKY